MCEPVVIGGIGGSGTRIPALICQKLGYNFGETNYALDAKSFIYFLDQWIPDYLIGIADNDQMTADFQECLSQHKATTSGPFWGLKNTRIIYLIRFLFDMLPNMKFIHVIRDGRDMAWSDNQQQLDSYGELFLSQEELSNDLPERKYLFCQRVNDFVAETGKEKTGQYIQVAFEDLCLSPDQAIKELLTFLDREGNISTLKKVIKPPSTIGQWKTKPQLLS